MKMALTKTIDEIKEMLPSFISNLSDTESLPNFNNIEYKYLVPIIGIDLYNDIHTKYNTDALGMADLEKNLLKKMRLVAVAYGYHDGLAMGHLTLTDNGVRKILPKDTQGVARWEFEKLQANLLNTALDATEVLLNFLFNNKGDFALWTASNEYKSFNSLLIKSGTEFNGFYTLYQPLTTYYSIRNAVSIAQKQYIEEGLGKSLFKYILEKQAPDDTLTDIIEKLKQALAYFTITKCCKQYNVRFSLEGFTVLSDGGSPDHADHAGRKQADPVQLESKMRESEKDGQFFMAQAKYDLSKYYVATGAPLPDADFKSAYEAGPLKSFEDPANAVSGNEGRKGIFVMGK
jgi:hypothetical protein